MKTSFNFFVELIEIRNSEFNYQKEGETREEKKVKHEDKLNLKGELN